MKYGQSIYVYTHFQRKIQETNKNIPQNFPSFIATLPLKYLSPERKQNFDSFFHIIKQKFKTRSAMGLSYSRPSSRRDFKNRPPKRTLANIGKFTLKSDQNHLEMLKVKKDNLDYTPTACTQTQPAFSRRSSKIDNCNSHIQQQIRSREKNCFNVPQQKKEGQTDQICASISNKMIQKDKEKSALAPISTTVRAAPRFSIESAIQQKHNLSHSCNPVHIDSVKLTFNSNLRFSSETDQEPATPKPTFLSKTITFSNKFAEMPGYIAQHNGPLAKITKEVRRTIIGKRPKI